MTDYVAQYWQSDQVAPSEFTESFKRYLHSSIDVLFNQKEKVKYNPETKCIELSFNCDKLGIELPDKKVELFEDIVNGIDAPTGQYSTSFIYHQFLNAIREKSDTALDSFSQSMTNDVIWRIGRYIGASNKMNAGNFRDDSVWERIHNE